jgi:hypothetical protein
MTNEYLLNYLIDLPIDDGIKVVLDAVFEWANLMVPSGTQEISKSVLQHARERKNRVWSVDIKNWTPRRYHDDLIGDFHIRIRELDVTNDKERSTHIPQSVDHAEITRRANELALFAQGLSVTDALQMFENLVAQWVTTCPLDALHKFVEAAKAEDPNIILTDERCMYLILKVLYDETEF